jgi:hypothetical protein
MVPRTFTRFASSLRVLVSSPVRLFLIFTLWALVLTYPLLLHFFSRIPLGSEEAGTVPFFNLWTLQWNIDQLLQGFPRYWDAPIFAPNLGTFAFSEPLLLSALLAAPLWLGLRSPTLGYDALVILFLTLNGWFAYWLLRNWELPVVPALLGGLLMQSLPFVAQEMGVLQLIAVFGFLWSLLYLHRFLAHSSPASHRPLPVTHFASPHRWQNGLCLALGTPVTFLTCGYYGLFSLFFLPLAFIFQFRPEHLRPKFGGQLILIGLLALILTLPLLWMQRQQLAGYNFTRSTQTIENNSAKLEYYRNFLDHNLLYGQLLGLKSKLGQRLFPGFGLMGLAVLGLFGSQQRRVKLYCLVAVGLALLLSLGLRLDLGEWQPYEWIRQNVPGFAQLRSPFRFAVLAQVHLALLAGFGLFNLGQWFRPHEKVFPILAAGLALFEALALPLPLQVVPELQTSLPWQVWLNEQGASEPGAAPLGSALSLEIVILPFASSNKVEDFEQTTRWILLNRHFRGAMLNGYSGFFPPDHAHVRELMLQFPTEAGLQLLHEKGIDYVVVYHGLVNAPRPEAIEKYLPLVYQDISNDVAIYPLK